MALMLWIQMNCIALLIGFELNASIAVNRDLRAVRPEEED
jgi:membrane protein